MKLETTISVIAVCMTAAYCLRCDEAEDCSSDECCVALTSMQLIGKGRCRKLGREGRSCNVPESVVEYYGGKYVSRCPCQEGLTCESRRSVKGFTHRFPQILHQRCKRSPTAVPPTRSTSTSTSSTASTSTVSTPSTSSESTSTVSIPSTSSESTSTVSTPSTSSDSTSTVSIPSTSSESTSTVSTPSTSFESTITTSPESSSSTSTEENTTNIPEN